MEWYSLSPEEVARRLGTDTARGLDPREAERRLEEHGPNVLEEGRRRTILDALVDQFKSVLVIILVAAAMISYFLGETGDAASILAILVFMAAMGVVQEYRAEKALEALKKLAAPKARVLRGGRVVEIDAGEVVPGDVLVLEEGDRVAADARLVESRDLYVDESMLTGESTPIRKEAGLILDPGTPLAERRNMVFMGTHVVRGRGRAVVVATGMDTVMGRIARSIAEAGEERTPLQRDLDVLGRRLGIIVVAVAAILFATGMMLHEAGITELFLASVALAVAAVPEGLPAIVTVILAVSVWRMARRNAVVRRLAAVEALGAATVICTDKTGTLTKNEMTVRSLWLPPGIRVEVTGAGYEALGELRDDRGRRLGVDSSPQLRLLVLNAALNNNAVVERGRDGARILGDPLEAALRVLAEKAGLPPRIVEEYERLREIPFTSERKMMSTINRVDGEVVLFSKGAPEVIVEKSSHVMLWDGTIKPMTGEDRDRILGAAEEMASKALRVLGFAYRVLRSPGEEDPEKNLVFLGLAGLMDPPRPEVPGAVRRALEAGIRVVMVTGDHKATAMAVAREVGIPVGEETVVTGRELDEMSDDELYERVDEITVYARVSPEHKARIVRALKRRGHIVAMTGDGVNDAPALKLADIGVAMGRRGTEVAKEASDIILADDNFATIVAAVEEGRVAYDNVRKAVLYLLSANMAEIISVFAAGLAGWGLLFTPAMLLWINLVTDAFPAAALAAEPPEPDVMKRPPRRVGEGMLGRRQMAYLLYIGIVLSAIVLGIYAYNRYTLARSHIYASTAAFAAMMFAELFHSMNTRSLNHSLLEIGLLRNKKHLLAILVSTALALAAIYIAPQAFKAEPLDAKAFDEVLAASATIILIEEARKRLYKEL